MSLSVKPDNFDPILAAYLEKEARNVEDFERDLHEPIVALRKALSASLSRVAELERETKRLADGLRWYAEGNHYDLPDWEDCSGESSNWLFPPLEVTEAGWMVDDGGIAQHILKGYSINPNHAEDDEITIPPETSGEVTQKA